jgi:hypothetical protein
MMESYRESRTWIPFREIEEFSLNPKSNGLAVSVQGEPLIVEFFSSPDLLRSQFRERSLGFGELFGWQNIKQKSH